jgi:hypothetical protein
VLCGHRHFWAEESQVLHHHANLGVIKRWQFRPGPMSRLEGVLLCLLHQLLLPDQRGAQVSGRRLSAAQPGHAAGVSCQRLSPGGLMRTCT